MFLSDKDIKTEVKAGRITLDPFDEKRVQPASYDIVLGNKFIINDPHTTTYIDPVKKVYPKTVEVRIPDNGDFVLHPGVSILGHSKDYFGSDDFVIMVNGKSSLARIGLLVHNSAALVNPGHYLQVALELCNLNNVPILLHPNMPIAQLTFSPLSSKSSKTYRDTGRYTGDNMKSYVPPKKGGGKKK